MLQRRIVRLRTAICRARPRARAALRYEACLPITGDGSVGPWPDGVAVQVHGMDAGPCFALEGDLDAARNLVATVGPRPRRTVRPPVGDGHLFTDASLPCHDPAAAALVVRRSRDLLSRLG